jgi:hypothetical protein
MKKQNYRRLLGEELSHRLLADFKKHGIASIERLRKDHIQDYFRTLAKLVPQEIEAEITHSLTDLLAKANERIIEGERVTNEHEQSANVLIHKDKHGIDNAIMPGNETHSHLGDSSEREIIEE